LHELQAVVVMRCVQQLPLREHALQAPALRLVFATAAGLTQRQHL
jgi:hypothetical protein